MALILRLAACLPRCGSLLRYGSLTALLAGLLLAPAPAQEIVGGEDAGLAQGELSMICTCGYSGFALPVANSELARDWAQRGGLQWQAAYNYSVLPVRVDIEHRSAVGFNGRIEVESSYPYASSESQAAASALISRDVLVPPSVPTSFYFAPRVCPPSEPGGLVEVQIRLFAGGSVQPQLVQSVSALQLEPSHVYTLLLDGQLPDIPGDAVNADNRLGLQLREERPEGLIYQGFSVTQFDNYIMPVERSVLTGLPLAARDFAFACADLQAVRQWPQQEQQALCAFMLGGGHLCLYNCGRESWQGLSLWDGRDAAPQAQAVGRGMLLPSAGDLTAARQAMRTYLEGELEEMVLWTGGTVRGSGLELPPALTAGRSGGLSRIYKGKSLPSRQPGYMHPIWAYRELFRSASLEPWDFPEFNLALADANPLDPADQGPIARVNRNYRLLDETERGKLPLPLAQQARPRPPWPLWPALAAMLTLGGLWPGARGGFLRLLLAGVGGLWLAALLLLSRPLVSQPYRLELIDADARLRPAAQRSLTARAMRGQGRIDVQLPPEALVRHVRGVSPGSWKLDAAAGGGFSVDCDGYASVSVDSWQPPDSEQPADRLAVRSRRLDERRVELVLDTSSLPPATGAWLLTPFGLQYVSAGNPQWRTELPLPRLPQAPGLARIAAWRASLSEKQGPGQLAANLLGEPWDLQLRALTLFPEACGAHSPLDQLSLGGLLQFPMGMRSCLGMQGVLFYENSPEATAAGGEQRSFTRLSFPLEASQ